MTLLFLCVLVPALLLCALKLSLAEKLWEIFPTAFLVAAMPLVCHQPAARTSLADLRAALGTGEMLQSVSALLALEAIVTLLLVAAVLTAHTDANTVGGASPHPRRSMRIYSGLAAISVIALLAAGLTASPPLWAMAGAGLILALAWPWLSVKPRFLTQPGTSKGRLAVILVTPVWALLSPAGLASILGAQMHLLYVMTGADLWQTTLGFSAVLAATLCIAPILLRLAIRDWRLRLDGVMLLAFLLLVGSMFLPQLVSDTPPPSSEIQVNWLATLIFAVTVILIGYLAHRGGFPRRVRPAFLYNQER